MAGYIGNKSSVVSSGAERKFKFTITETTTTLSNLAYTPNLVHVFHNGIRLVDGTDYTATNGTSITLANAAEDGDEVVVISYASFQTSDTVSASAGGTFGGDITVNGDLTVNTDTLFVDSANNRVGIGTSLPTVPLDIGPMDNADEGAQVKLRGAPNGTVDYNFDVYQSNFRFFTTDKGNNNNFTERMRIDSAGRVTTPYQPMFIGRHNDLYSSTFTTGSIIPLTVVDVNIGSHWNPSTYRFTCPVTGIYECVGVDISQVNAAASLGVYKNGTLQYRRYTEDREKGVFGKLSCVTGDYLEFRIAEGSTTLFGNSGYAQYSIRLIG